MSAVDAGLLLALIAGCYLGLWICSALRFAVDDEAVRKVVGLFQPRWKREAEFLARNIPHGDAWS